MLLVPISQDTVARALSKRVSLTESLDDTINRALSREESNLYKDTECSKVDGSRPKIRTNSKACYFKLFGNRQDASKPTELFVSVLTALGARDGKLYEQLSKEMGDGKQRTRRMIAKNRQDLYPQSARPGVKREARPLPGGWWVGTSYSTKTKMLFLQRVCGAAEINFGTDLVIDPRLLDGVTLALTDDEL
jgi:hypothetical protein